MKTVCMYVCMRVRKRERELYVGTMYCDSRSNRNKRGRGSWDLDAIGQTSGSQET